MFDWCGWIILLCARRKNHALQEGRTGRVDIIKNNRFHYGYCDCRLSDRLKNVTQISQQLETIRIACKRCGIISCTPLRANDCPEIGTSHTASLSLVAWNAIIIPCCVECSSVCGKCRILEDCKDCIDTLSVCRKCGETVAKVCWRTPMCCAWCSTERRWFLAICNKTKLH